MLLSFDNQTCSGCKACQLVCALHNFKETNPAHGLLNVYGRFPAPGKYFVDCCSQCGACADACPVDAIEEKQGAYLIDHDACIGCGACADACELKVIRLIDELPYKCTSCGECVEVCPRDALRLEEEEVKA